MKKFFNIYVLSLLILIYFSKSVLAAAPMLTMMHPMTAQTNHSAMALPAGHCLNKSHGEHGSATSAAQMDVALVTSHDASPASADCDATCQCCIGNCSPLALLLESHRKQAISSPDLTPDFDLQLLPQHAVSLFKPPIFS
jgi:hypothetical protein